MRSKRLVPIVIVLLAMLGVLGALGWLRFKFQQQEQRFLESAVRPFELSEVLLRPEENSVDFEEVEFLAQSLGEREIVRQLVVTKSTPRGEVTLYPFFLGVLEPEWKSKNEWTIRPILVESEAVGKIYLQLDRSTRNAIDRALILTSGLFVTSLLLLLIGYLQKDVRLELTTQELRNRQREMIRLERLALVGQLSANIFHDIKKPVQNIKHAATDAMSAGELSLQDAEEIHAHSELFLQMLRELGVEKFSQGNNDEREYCDLEEIVERSIALVRYEQGGTVISTSVAKNLPLVLCSSTQLVQVFSNLLLNAYQAMKQQGEVQITIVQTETEIAARVQDSGLGIDQEIAPRIFMPFETTKQGSGGTGLGLFIAHQIMEQWGGSIELERCRPACFKLSFPKPLWETD